jgi:hypothetical protein
MTIKTGNLFDMQRGGSLETEAILARITDEIC